MRTRLLGLTMPLALLLVGCTPGCGSSGGGDDTIVDGSVTTVDGSGTMTDGAARSELRTCYVAAVEPKRPIRQPADFGPEALKQRPKRDDVADIRDVLEDHVLVCEQRPAHGRERVVFRARNDDGAAQYHAALNDVLSTTDAGAHPLAV